MAVTLQIPLAAFTTSGGLIAADQFCQEFEIAIPTRTIIDCFQDFATVTLEVDAPLTAPEQATLDALVAAHTATGRITVGTVASLAPGLFEGEDGFATDGRKVGEGPGAGTGVPIYWSTGSWRVFSTDTPVTT